MLPTDSCLKMEMLNLSEKQFYKVKILRKCFFPQNSILLFVIQLPKLATLVSDEKYLHQVGVEAFEEFSYQPPCLVFFMGNEKLGEGKGKKKLWQQEILDY